MEQALIAIDELGAEFGGNSDRLIGIEAVKIWYCSYGRNAWNSTWKKQYVPGCMQISEEAAEQKAEYTRNYGNVHYLREKPALRFIGRHHSLIVTQINTDTPLREYSVRPARGAALGREHGERESYFVFGATLGDVAKTFAPNSRFWKVAQPERNSVVRLFAVHPANFASLQPADRLASWKSISYGGSYFLNWEEIRNRARSRYVLELALKANFGPAGGAAGSASAHPSASSSMGKTVAEVI